MAQHVPRYVLADDYSIARVINGGWQLADGHRRRPVDPRDAIDAMLRLVDAGLTTFDCAEIYGGVEQLIGRLIRELSTASTIQVHTKFVPDLDALPGISKSYVERIVDRSLRRLGIERLDLVQLHWWDYEVPRYVETALWLGELQRAGKIRHLGATNFDVPHLAEIVEAGVRIVCHQVQFSLLDRRPENGMLRFCADHGIQLLCYGSLGGGFISDRYLGQPTPASPAANRSLTKYGLIVDELGGWERFQQLLEVASRVAAKHGVGLSNVAVRYVLDKPQVAAAIVGARDARHLEGNLRTFLLELDEEDRRLLDGAPDSRRGPSGDVYSLERIRNGPHAAIMKYNLNRSHTS